MLEVQASGPVLRLTLARPEVRNALNSELIEALLHAFSHVGPDVRAVVLTGEGSAFCAGGDLEYMRKTAAYYPEQNYQDALRVAELFQIIADCRAAVIARVNGHAFGGGAGLAAAADVAVCADSALFAFSEVRLGLVPATISRFVVEKIGRSHARALFCTGASFGAERALRIGLVHDVVPAAELDGAVEGVVKDLLRCGQRAVTASKKLALGPILTKEDAAHLLANVRAGDEAAEGIRAFLAKERASFVVG